MSSFIEIQVATETQDSTGDPVKVWRRFCRAWAQVRSTDTLERFQSDRDIGHKLRFFVLRYRSDVSFEHRIIFKEESYNIRSIKQVEKLGRDRFMEILGEVIE